MKVQFIFQITLLFSLLFLYNNCTPGFEASNDINSIDEHIGGSDVDDKKLTPTAMNQSSFRKLTNNEIYNKIKSVFNIEFNVQQHLGEEPLTPFNNSIKDQIISENLVSDLEYFARKLSEAILNSQSVKNQLYICAPQKPDDINCLGQIMNKLFSQAFITPPETSSIEKLKIKLTQLSKESGSFNTAVEGLLLFIFQSPRFIYTQYGAGNINRGIYTLSEIEFANKISFLITGAPADSQLVDRALSNQLKDSITLANELERLFQKPGAVRQMLNFHSMWFGYYQSQLPPVIAVNAIRETELVLKEHLLEQNKAWIDLLQLDYTYVNNALGSHYGFPNKTSNEFYKVYYSSTGQPRKGIFSHATFLSAVPKIGDSSPTKRGYQIIKSLLCDKIGKPPADVDLDVLPEPTNGGNCKHDSYIALKTNPACMGCHIKMDGIGLGLENFSHLGKYRKVEKKDPNCKVSGDGEIYNMGKFNGVTGFSDLLYSNKIVLESCLVEKMSLFAYGFNTKESQPLYLQRLQKQFNNHGSYKSLIKDIISSKEFKEIVWK